MKAIQIVYYGFSEVLHIDEIPIPEPVKDEIFIKVLTAGVNFAEILARQGLYPDAPFPDHASP